MRACGVIGRMLLELRECVRAESRFTDPWVVVLEEAHNYVKPRRQEESRGIEVSRETFERIAREGRKFGLSLIVASQRPSDVSPTVFSQCANSSLPTDCRIQTTSNTFGKLCQASHAACSTR